MHELLQPLSLLTRLKGAIVLGGHWIRRDWVPSTFMEGPASKGIWPPDQSLKVFEALVSEGVSHSGGDCKLGVGWRWDDKVGPPTKGPKIGREDEWLGFDGKWPENNPMSCPRSEAYDGSAKYVLSFMRRSIKPPWLELLISLLRLLEKLNEPKLTSVI